MPLFAASTACGTVLISWVIHHDAAAADVYPLFYFSVVLFAPAA
jgi:hypothetical protein